MRSSVRAFTLVEMLVVTSISLILLTVGGLVYTQSLKIYREARGLTGIHNTARLINSELRKNLGSVVPVPGGWIMPLGRHFGAPVASGSNLDLNYQESAVHVALVRTGTVRNVNKQSALNNTNRDYDFLFSYPQFTPRSRSNDPTSNMDDWQDSLGYGRSQINPHNWNAIAAQYPGLSGWWMPAFFGQASGALGSTVVRSTDNRAGAWGWPRADYRMHADADDYTNANDLACWFYAESNYFNNPYTSSLDNANIMLVSLKFAITQEEDTDEDGLGDSGAEVTRLSILRHSIVGFDTADDGLVKKDLSFGDTIRMFRIVPLYIGSSGLLQAMSDSEIGAEPDGKAKELTNTATDPALNVPSAFDVTYRLRSPGNMKHYAFTIRIHNFISPR